MLYVHKEESHQHDHVSRSVSHLHNFRIGEYFIQNMQIVTQAQRVHNVILASCRYLRQNKTRLLLHYHAYHSSPWEHTIRTLAIIEQKL